MTVALPPAGKPAKPYRPLQKKLKNRLMWALPDGCDPELGPLELADNPEWSKPRILGLCRL
jgi:hypothetical protein